MVVDEPGSGVNPTRPILNCGNNGAPDVSLAGPGVCSIISTGNPALNYDGTPNGYGTATCDGLAGRPAPNSLSSGVCGRPNVFQGRLPNPSYPNQVLFPSQVLFEDVPLDPPGTTTTRTMRFTNLRVNAASVNRAAPNTLATVQVTVSTDNQASMAIDDPQQVIAYIEPGLNPNPSSCSGAGPLVCFQEGFAASWRPKNISFAVGNLISGNANFSPSNPEFYWAYNGGQNYPPDVAQNVPGAVYNSESGFEWQNSSPNGPPSPNPPQGIGVVAVEPGLAGPLSSEALAFPSTGIGAAGVANSGTRIRVQFTGLPAGASIQIPTVVTLSSSTTASSGVIVLTNSDSAGAGQFSPYNTATVTLPNNGGSAFAVYEVLWADPFSVETAAVPYTLLNAAPGTTIQTSSAFAPFYSDSASYQQSATAPVPRFLDSALLCAEQSCLNVSPNQGVNTAPIQLSFTSYGNQPLTGAQVVLRASGLPDIPGTNAASSTPSTLVATFDLTAATPGFRDIVITPVGLSSIVLPTEFIVTGVAPVVVPNLVGASQAFATSVITSYQLVVGTVTQQSSNTISAGSVISQSPAAGVSVNVGTAVNLVISSGPLQVVVPNVVGQAQAAATAAITSAALSVGAITPQSSNTVPAGNVISESPVAGTVVNAGSSVNIVVSAGVVMVAVPNVVGATTSNAAVAITNSGLTEQSQSLQYVDYGVYSGPKNLVLQGVPGTTQSLLINLAGDPASWDTLQLSITSSASASSASNPLGSAAGVALAGSATNAPAALAFSFGDSLPGNAIWVGSTLWGNGITGGFSDGDAYATFLTGAQLGGPYYEGWIHFKIQNSALPTATLTVVDWDYLLYPVLPYTIGEIPASGVPAGDVITQSPAAGTLVPVGSGVTITVSEGPVPAVVPVATGQTLAQARIIITGQGLLIGTVTQQSSTTVPSGSVIGESPVAGTTTIVGASVNVVISTGPPLIAVPNVVGSTQAAATTAIASAGLSLRTVTQQLSNTVPAGSVISESPTAGTLVVGGSPVDLLVSSGSGVVVPNLVGQTEAAATAAIVNAGLFEASNPQVFTDQGFYSGPKNLVLQGVSGTPQTLTINLAGDPAGWDTLQLSISPSGTASVGSNTITSTAGVALAGNPANIPVVLPLNLGDPYPNNPAIVSGSLLLWGNGATGGFSDGEQYAAMMFGTQQGGPYYLGWIHFNVQNSALPTATLTVIDWAYEIIVGPSLPTGQLPVRDVPTGIVASQTPAAGTLVKLDSGVNIYVSAGPTPVQVPNVAGQTQSAGTIAILSGGMVAGTVTQQSSSSVPSGSIISQSPAANSIVVISSAVNLVVSTGPAQVAVPNVVGSTQAAATSTITGAGLVVGTITQQSSSTVPSGSVISESPAAGTSVNAGSAVNLVVSTGPAMIAIPNVVGSTQASATTAITSAGLVVGTVTQQSSSTVAAGSVISESPVSGTLVTLGSAVNLVVSSGPAQSGPPPSFVQVNQNEISSGSSVAVRLNAATKAGNTIVVYAIWDNAGSASVKDSRSDNFVSVSPPVTWGNGYSAQIFYATNIVGGTDTVTVSFKQATSLFGVAYAHEYSGINTTNPIDVIASASGSSATLNSGAATTTSANDLIFGAGVSDNNVGAAGSGFTARDLNYGNITEDRTAASIGSYSATATHFGQQWGMQMVAFRAAGTSGSGGGVVASPTFNPPAGTYPSAQSVKLTTATAGASIYYTTDGSAPSTLSTLYTVPISVNSSLTIKAIAHEAGMTDSPIVSAAYQIGAAGTPPAFVQVNDNDISAGSSVPVSFNNPVKAGNTIVVYAIWDNAGSASITDTLGNHFVSVSAPVSWGNGYSAQIFYATNLAAGADTVKAAFATPATIFGVIYAHEYSGISASNPLDVIASASGSSATLNSGVATTTSANDLIFGAGVSDNNVTKAGTGFTARDLDYGNITEDKTAASIGSYSATATHNGQQWGMQMVAFRPAQ